MAKAIASKGNRRRGTKSKPARASGSGQAAAIRRYCRPGAIERGLRVIAQGIADGENDREILALRAEFLQLRAKLPTLGKRFAPLRVAFGSILKLNGFEAAAAWSKETEYDALNHEISDLNLRATDLVDSMIKLQPKTLAGIAATAAAFKEDQANFWEEPEPDRDWEISLLTRFLDGLIDLGKAPRVADRVLVQGEEA
jgi:hypothetical protein